jgi:hypothetical protein
MWKSDLNVVSTGIVFHNPCGNRCGNLLVCVEKESEAKVFHISTGYYLECPVEMWKTQSQFIDTEQVS